MNILRPYKSDIQQIETLVKLGVSFNDTASILGITPDRLKDWQSKSKPLSELLKQKPLPEFTLHHPDFEHQVEEVFTCAGKRYYRFKDEFRMPIGRYKYFYSTLRELELKLNLKTLREFVDGFKNILNGGRKKTIEITDLHKLILNLESRLELEFDTRTVRKLAAVAYFDETEDVTSFDDKHGEQKIALWLEHNTHDFFLTRQIGELLNVKDISIESLEEHLKTMNQILEDLDLDLHKVFAENS